MEDGWWCGTCQRKYPTRAYKCQHDNCWEWAFTEPFCERHKQSYEQT
jgi:hypothetical protein